MTWWQRLADSRPPDFIIGTPEKPYLLRWWVIPRNPIFNIYLHKFLRSDDDRALHDHPWFNVSIILDGWYVEITPKGRFLRQQGHRVWRSPWAAHRVQLPAIGTAWTLFITGPRLREWYFHCPQGLRHWKEFTDPADKGQIGKGCN